MLKGLPHPFEEKRAFSEELDSKPVRDILGSFFYQELHPLNVDDQAAIRSALADPRTFLPGPVTMKLCGGFHADFAVEFQHDGEVGAALICFGCSEIKTLFQRDRWHHNLRPQALFVLKLVLRQASGDFPV